MGGDSTQVRPIIGDRDIDDAPRGVVGRCGGRSLMQKAGQGVGRRPHGRIELEQQGVESWGCLDQPRKRMGFEVSQQRLGEPKCGVGVRVLESDQQGIRAIRFDVEIHGC